MRVCKKVYILISISIDMSLKNNIKLLKCLGEETKYRIVRLLLKGERCACKIPGAIDRTQSNTSMHLAKLVGEGILKSRRDGKKILYSIKDSRVCDIFEVLRNKKTRATGECCCKVCK